MIELISLSHLSVASIAVADSPSAPSSQSWTCSTGTA